MKDIKSYVIGFLTCACLFLIMGQTKSESQIGRYQAHGAGIVDTTNGQKYEPKQSGYIARNNLKYWWQKVPGRIIKP